MVCREYEGELKDLAAGDLASHKEAEVRVHLAGCAACREALDAERQLFAAVDAALGEEMKAEVPASLAARIRAGVAEDVARPEATWWRWGALAGTAVAAVVLLMLVRGNKPSEVPEKPVRPAEAAEKVTPRETLGAAATVHVAQRRRFASSIRRTSASEVKRGPEVIVSSREEQALLEWMAERERWRQEATVVAVRVALDAPFEIAPLEVKPLGEEEPQ